MVSFFFFFQVLKWKKKRRRMRMFHSVWYTMIIWVSFKIVRQYYLVHYRPTQLYKIGRTSCI